MDDVREVLAGERPLAFATGHCVDLLRTLPDGCVSCVVTSPPYFSLRDYGTATWEGGDLGCDHKQSVKRQNMDKLSEQYRGGGHKASTREGTSGQPRASCRHCGAVRVDQQIGLEETPAAYVAKMVEVFAEVRRVLHPSGACFVNIGDSYNGSGAMGAPDKQATNRGACFKPDRRGGYGTCKQKDLLGIPWMLAFALRDDGWYLRSEITLCKTSPMPESVRDRPTQATEKLFLLTKSAAYFYDQEAERAPALQPLGEPRMTGQHKIRLEALQRHGQGENSTLGTNQGASSRNLWNYWSWASDGGFPEAHFATFPSWLPRRCIRLGSSERGVCPKCFAPWQRILERKQVKRVRPHDHVKRTGENGTGNSCANTVAGVTVRSKGWEPTCKCGLEPIPALILDPFSGAGTTVMVANQLGRRAIGLELNPQYVELSKRRICNASLKKDEMLPGDPLPLFGDL